MSLQWFYPEAETNSKLNYSSNGNREALGTMLRGTFHMFHEVEEIADLLP